MEPLVAAGLLISAIAYGLWSGMQRIRNSAVQARQLRIERDNVTERLLRTISDYHVYLRL